MTERDMRSWSVDPCDKCGCEVEFSLSEPRDSSQPFLCYDCKLAKRNYDAGYADGYAAGLAAAKEV